MTRSIRTIPSHDGSCAVQGRSGKRASTWQRQHRVIDKDSCVLAAAQAVQKTYQFV